MQPYKERTVAKGQIVEIYRNLNNGLLSVRDYRTKQVLAHCETIELHAVQFKVHQKGRERVIREKRKNVHAFIIGRYMGNPAAFSGTSKVSYNPYKVSQFVNVETGTPIHAADYVFVAKEGTIISLGDKQ